MKEIDNLDDVATKSLPVFRQDADLIGYMRPVSADLAFDQDTVERLARWRGAHEYAFPSRSAISPSSTAAWLESAVIEKQERLLFLITDTLLRPLGHMGLLLTPQDDLEIDNVLRGENSVPGLMRSSLATLEHWCEQELDEKRLTLRVLHTNSKAVSFYASLGYSESGREKLTWDSQGPSRRLVPSPTGSDDVFLHMEKDLRNARPAQERVLTAGPLVGVREASLSLHAVRSGWNENHSEYLNAFEAEFAAFVGAEFAIGTSSCTGALHLALLALGIGRGDEVIVPQTTWVATAAAVRYVGAVPVFADVDESTWTLSLETLQSHVSSRTRAIIPVHLYGYPANMTALMSFAQDHGILVIEDAAPAIGALVDGRPVGSFGDMAAFSFQGAKMLVTGEGGMLVTSDSHLRARAWKYQDHGRVPGTFWIDELGYKYKMSNVTAALGLAQLKSVETQIEKKRRINGWYREFLSGTPGVRFQEEGGNTSSICWMTSIVLDDHGPSRDDLAREMGRQGIDTRPVFPPIGSYPIWGTTVRPPAPTASRLGTQGLNLPSGVRLSRASVERVSAEIDRIIRESA